MFGVNGQLALWNRFHNELGDCRDCISVNGGSLIANEARPLFGRFEHWPRGALFVFEAPNRADTVDDDRGYLTIDHPKPDPSDRFTCDLIRNELQLDPRYFQVTNSVLCLPRFVGGKYEVSSAQTRRCSRHLRRMIDVLEPSVVCPLGGRALAATRLLGEHPFRKLADAVAHPVPWFGRWLFPLAHTSRLGRNGKGGRRDKRQRADWRALRSFLVGRGVAIPGPVYRGA